MLPGAVLDRVRAERKLAERLETVGLRDELAIELEVVPHLSWDANTGKFRRLVSLVGPPKDLDPAESPGVSKSEMG